MPIRKGREKEYDREWRLQHPERRSVYMLRENAKRYGMTSDEYTAFLSQPCQICGKPAEVVDHCHGTNQVRGALCHRCNRGLGFFKDNEDSLMNAITYLREFQSATE
jgi:hypothetical protein